MDTKKSEKKRRRTFLKQIKILKNLQKCQKNLNLKKKKKKKKRE